MSLTDQLNGVFTRFKENAPDAAKLPILEANAQFAKTFDLTQTIQVGDNLPPFRLPNALGEEVSSTDLLARGPLLITFYRGSWCPFCDLAVQSLQRHLSDFQSKGVTLVAITPELPDYSLSLTEKHDLKFPVLTDRGNQYAEQLGLLFRMPESLRPVFKAFGHDLVEHNGDDSFVVPVTATLLVDERGVVRNAFIDPNYAKRLEPAVAMEWINSLQS
ncbi:redoxin domain-containing protein [Aspergillus karnatakaensis]|uniref:peroxiredoxin-like family protein n=1 Tax=Aspergillus karnatakaensis TaxID=1810916 RepID=UPI003CCD0669